MSRIEKMSIQGIRSFGPSETDKGVVKFQTPLTLILGPNGTGKTTIIECLRYMTTGKEPPGSKSVFVHDPKIAKFSQVKGQIQLVFTDPKGQMYLISRSMQATQTVKGVKFNTLDGVISTRKNGEKVDLPSRCGDLNQEMANLLGVSHPILNYVIFCHQEESNWPLEESKQLKEKFDSIFASTRYVKALDVIRKVSKEKKDLIREYQVEIKFLKDNKDKAVRITADLKELEGRLHASKDSLINIEEEMAPIVDKLQKIGSKEKDVIKLHTKIEKMKSERDTMKKALMILSNKIQNKFTGSTAELKQELNDFCQQVENSEIEMSQVERKRKVKEDKLNSIGADRSRILLEQGRLEEEARMNQENTKSRDQIVQSIADQYNISGFDRNFEERVPEFIQELERVGKDLFQKAKKNKMHLEKEENEKQQQINETRAEKTQKETQLQMKQDEIRKNQEEVRRISHELNRVDASAERLDSIRVDLKKTESELKSLEKSLNPEDVKKEIGDLQEEKSAKDSQLKKLEQELSRLHQESKVRLELDLLQKQHKEKEEQIRKCLARHEDDLKQLFGRIPEDGLKTKVDKLARELTDEVQQLTKDMENLKLEQSTKAADKRNLKNQKKDKEEELRNLQRKIEEVCEPENFMAEMESMKEKMEYQQKKRGLIEGSQVVYNHFIEKLQKKSECPLCHNEFRDTNTCSELITEIEDRIRGLPRQRDDAKTALLRYETKYNKMLGLVSERERVVKLNESELPELNSSIRLTQSHTDELENKIEELGELLENKMRSEDKIKRIQPDMAMVNRYRIEVEDLQNKIDLNASKVTSGGTHRNVELVTSERKELQNQLDLLNHELDQKKEMLSSHKDQVHRLQSCVNKLEADKLAIERDLEQRTKLEDEMESLETKSVTLYEEIQAVKDGIEPIQNQINNLTREKEAITKKKECQYEKDREGLDKVENQKRELELLERKVQRYISTGSNKNLKQNEKRLKELEADASQLEDELKNDSELLNEIRDKIASQQVRERELSDNLQLRKNEKEIEHVNQDLSQLQEELGGLDATNLLEEKHKLNRQYENLNREKNHSIGRQDGLTSEIESKKSELQEKMYVDAEEKYRKKIIELRTTEMANKDLDKYYRALDRTIMTYHNQKMLEINKIIKELWRNTYRGNDIETIEICSDEDSKGTASTARRVYNYRVVAIRNGAQIDMRGRCSAGQRVLASLIIRLALAETFCLNCGVLALDEPTTNLDRENIESLASALVEIIKSRESQQNFQLVVITHDEDFVELLGRSDYVETFLRVSKNADGCSRITESRVENLH